MKGEGYFRTVTFVLATIVGSKNKSIYLRSFKDVDFTHFANFKFACFEIEESFGLINLCKITKWLISLASFNFGYLKGARFK